RGSEGGETPYLPCCCTSTEERVANAGGRSSAHEGTRETIGGRGGKSVCRRRLRHVADDGLGELLRWARSVGGHVRGRAGALEDSARPVHDERHFALDRARDLRTLGPLAREVLEEVVVERAVSAEAPRTTGVLHGLGKRLAYEILVGISRE